MDHNVDATKTVDWTQKWAHKILSQTVWVNFNQFDVIGLGPSLSYEAAQFGEITQNNGQYAVQGYSRSLISEPLESPYATSW